MTLERVNESLTAERYRVFSQVDAQDLSPVYCDLANAIADDAEVLDLVDTLPPAKRQAGFLFSAARYFDVPFDDYRTFRASLLEKWDEIAVLATTRTLQTNDPARLLAILPAIADLEGPIALLEVGSSAGLCLNADRYSYRWGDGEWVHPADGPSNVRLEATISGPVPVPKRLPDIVWRAGIDLRPLNPRDTDDARWLRALLWPDSEGRRRNLDAAIEVLREHPVTVIEGDLNERLLEVARLAPRDATLVILHSAVLPYVEQDEAEQFVSAVRDLGAVWVCNELADVVPGVDIPAESGSAFSFVVARDGVPLARAHPHGTWLRWHAEAVAPERSRREDVGRAS